jgi:hypothetical protein
LQLSILASAWRGSDFVLSDEHLRGLAGRFGARYEQAENRAQMLERLCRCNAGVIYLYCHGGIDPSGDPYVLVGEDPLSPITVDNLAMLPIDWSESRPLVFVNGCHTTALEPRRALQFVDELVREAHAVGVIGTEITIFEPLAVAFAEKFLGKYEAGSDVGSAIRDARLELLGEQLNPLGLLYIPYVLSTVRWNRPQMPSR